MLIELVESTIRAKMLKWEDSHICVLQLSKFFMNKFVEELNTLSGVQFSDTNFLEGHSAYHVKYICLEHEWTILHREFRDNTNDPDFEEALFTYLKEKSC